MINKISEIDTELRPTLDEKQKELYEAYDYLQTAILDDFGLQSFIYGYALGQQLQIDSNNAMYEILPEIKKKLDGNSEV